MQDFRFRRLQSTFRKVSLHSLTLLLALALAGVLMGVQVGHGQESATVQDAPFGPVLFLIEAPAGQWRDKIPPTTVLHARLEGPPAGYIASGAASDVAELQATGVTVKVLDAATDGRVYYLAEAQTLGQATDQAPAPVGEALYQDGQVVLLAAPAAQELALVDSTTQHGVPVSLLSSAPLAPETADGMLVEAADSALLPPDPTVAGLLPRLSVIDLRNLVDKLSGQLAFTVGGAQVTLTTRHTLSNRVPDATRFVYEYYTALGLSVSYFNWTYGSYSGRNVVAEVRGNVNPEKVLIVGGHLDDTSQTPYTTAPGADDNATGTAATLLLARILKDYRPSVTVRFVHFTGEEQGQWGSKVYASTLRARGEQVIGFIDLDMIGWDGNKDRVVEIHTANGPKSNALATAFLERNTRYGIGLVFERKMNSASRFSDHSPFWDNDYASFLVIENFFDDAIVRDRNPYYHNTGDLPFRVDYDYVARIGRVALASLYELADYQAGGPPPPTPTPTPTPPPTPDPGACVNLLANGSFELNSTWSFGSTPFPARYVTNPVYEGLRAAGSGIPAGNANRLAHSSAYQKITIPANAATPVTIRWVQRTGGAGDGYDYREALLLNASYGYLAKLERSYGAGNDTWTSRLYDLTAYRGQTIVVYFNVYNNGTGTQMWNYVDRVILGSCGVQSANGEPPALPQPMDAKFSWNVFLPAVNQ